MKNPNLLNCVDLHFVTKSGRMCRQQEILLNSLNLIWTRQSPYPTRVWSSALNDIQVFFLCFLFCPF